VVDGIITMNALSSLPELTMMIGDAPGCSAPSMPMPAVSPASALTTSMRRGGVAAESGHRRIALINHDLSYRYARLRERGYKSVLHVRELAYQQVAMPATSAPPPVKRQWKRCWPPESGRMRYLPSPTRWRRAPLRAIAQAGLRVPDDIAVMDLMARAGGDGLAAADHRGTAVARHWPHGGDPAAEENRQPGCHRRTVMMDWRIIARASA
jgi:hypothetical protein